MTKGRRRLKRPGLVAVSVGVFLLGTLSVVWCFALLSPGVRPNGLPTNSAPCYNDGGERHLALHP